MEQDFQWFSDAFGEDINKDLIVMFCCLGFFLQLFVIFSCSPDFTFFFFFGDSIYMPGRSVFLCQECMKGSLFYLTFLSAGSRCNGGMIN